MSDKPKASATAAYLTLYPMLVELAKLHGYALAVHGSVARDFDLIAVPWTDFACDAEVLVEAMRASVGGSLESRMDGMAQGCEKPHGRRAWSIYLGMAYIDVSVMPRTLEMT